MKKVLFSCMTVSLLAMTSALAEGTAVVATKDYVDAGLQAVYTRARNLTNTAQNDVDELTLYVGAPTVDETPGTGLTKRIEDLEVNLENVGANIVYTGDGRGVLVTDDRRVGIVGLTESTGTNNKMYVFQNNMATELEVDDTWHEAE
ncbi:MAG: hypothetical protein J5611_01820 [Alphaproteobacteria bacterium]|nr:hypothetical protein [Alphaproteobacteria bacterium]